MVSGLPIPHRNYFDCIHLSTEILGQTQEDITLAKLQTVWSNSWFQELWLISLLPLGKDHLNHIRPKCSPRKTILCFVLFCFFTIAQQLHLTAKETRNFSPPLKYFSSCQKVVQQLPGATDLGFIGMRTVFLIIFPKNHLLLSCFLTHVSKLAIFKKLYWNTAPPTLSDYILSVVSFMLQLQS